MAQPETTASGARRTAIWLLDQVLGEGRLLSDCLGAETLDRLPAEERARAQRLATETLRGFERADRLLPEAPAQVSALDGAQRPAAGHGRALPGRGRAWCGERDGRDHRRRPAARAAQGSGQRGAAQDRRRGAASLAAAAGSAPAEMAARPAGRGLGTGGGGGDGGGAFRRRAAGPDAAAGRQRSTCRARRCCPPDRCDWPNPGQVSALPGYAEGALVGAGRRRRDPRAGCWRRNRANASSIFARRPAARRCSWPPPGPR